MVQITSVVLAALLIAPSLAVPIVNGQQFDAREAALAVREPSSGIDSGFELSERDVQVLEDILERDPNFFGNVFRGIRKVASPKNLGTVAKVASWVIRDLDAVELSERDIQELEEMIERDPSWFKKAFRSIKRIATPGNLGKAANLASNFIREDELEALAELAARDPNWFKKAFRSIRRIASPANIGKVANVASNFIREDAEEVDDLLAREYEEFDELD